MYNYILLQFHSESVSVACMGEGEGGLAMVFLFLVYLTPLFMIGNSNGISLCGGECVFK